MSVRKVNANTVIVGSTKVVIRKGGLLGCHGHEFQPGVLYGIMPKGWNRRLRKFLRASGHKGLASAPTVPPGRRAA